MRTLGAVDAINLDGGGSTTMTVGDQVVNQPSDSTGERPVGDALVLLPAQTDRPRLKAALATPAGNGRTRSMKPGTLARSQVTPRRCYGTRAPGPVVADRPVPGRRPASGSPSTWAPASQARN
jgi:hypothetical protein